MLYCSTYLHIVMNMNILILKYKNIKITLYSICLFCRVSYPVHKDKRL